jgi:hypothetical protein
MSKFKGVITHIGEVIELGNYKKMYVHVVENEGEYPQSCNFEVFGEAKVDNVLKYNRVGDVVEVRLLQKKNKIFYSENTKKLGEFKEEIIRKISSSSIQQIPTMRSTPLVAI